MQKRKEICKVGQLLEQRGFIAATDGNISTRIGANKILITPTGCPKGRLQPKDLVTIDATGKKIAGNKKPSGELYTHLAFYHARKDISAIVHAHLPWTTALTIAGISLEEPILPETFVAFGPIPTATYATPSSFEGAASIAELVKRNNLIVLDRHGAIACGNTLMEAYYRLEKLEATSKIVAIAHMLGKVKRLNKQQIEKLYDLRKNLGL